MALVDTPGQTSTNWNITQGKTYTPENTANKTTTMTGNTASNTVFLTAKAVYDWATGLFALTTHNHTGTYQPLATVLTNTTASYTTTIDTRLANTSGANTGDQTITNSSDATSHTITLSATG